MTIAPPEVYAREYTNGRVLLNGSPDTQTISVGAGYARIAGSQAPRDQRILDDDDDAFTATGDWVVRKMDSGEWKAAGPFYHDWGDDLHKLNGASGEARWTLPITRADTYEVRVWYPAAPQANTWNANAVYEIVANGQVIANAALDQRGGGDEWHSIANVALAPGDNAFVRLTCSGAPCVADAVYLESAARYNDGSAVSEITLAPLDGIILRRAP
jgi:hypothetical protein